MHAIDIIKGDFKHTTWILKDAKLANGFYNVQEIPIQDITKVNRDEEIGKKIYVTCEVGPERTFTATMNTKAYDFLYQVFVKLGNNPTNKDLPTKRQSKSHLVYGGLGAFFLYAMIGIGGESANTTSLSERYPGPWQEDFNLGISKALAGKKIRGCGQYKFRESSMDKKEYLVYCTRDGNDWLAYLVWPNIGSVTGPHAPDPSLH